MRAVVIRVSRADITINGEKGGNIGKGLLVLLGINHEDTEKECKYLAEKCIGLRIFEDENGKMNKGLTDVCGEIMLVSNFTLYADCSHGKRPSFINAARPEQAIPLYEKFKDVLRENGVSFVTGEFGADMQVSLINDGPVTILLDSGRLF